MQKILVVHDGDSDGRTAAALFLQTMLLLKLMMEESEIEKIDSEDSLLKRASTINQMQFYETRSRDSIEWMRHVDKETVVVILDLTFRREHFEQMLSVTDSVFVVDHHEGYDFASMDANCMRGFGKCQLPDSDMFFMMNYSTVECTTGLVYKMYQDVLVSALRHMKFIAERMQMTNLKVFMNSRHESRLEYEGVPPNKENFYLDPTWLPNKEFVAHVVDFDLNKRELPDSPNFDAGLRALLDGNPKNNLWGVYHMLFRTSFLELGKSFIDANSLVTSPDEHLRVGDIISAGREDLKAYIASLNEQIHYGPKYIQMGRGENEPDMGAFIMLKCMKYQTQIGAAALEANPGFSYAILHYEEDGHEKLSFRRNFDPKYANVNLRELTGKLGLMLCGEPRGGGHPGSSGLRLTNAEFVKFCEFINRTCGRGTKPVGFL